MKARARILVALLALFAFTAAFAEQVWASTCAPATEMTHSASTHLQAMHGADGDSLRRMLPVHRQMTAAMMAEMSGEMRQMNMPADSAWTATPDSLQQDLVRMPEMGVAELQAAMPAHEARLERLMQMHRSMTGDTTR